MTPSEYAEAIIIVIKRLLKWAGWTLGAVLTICLCIYAFVSAQKWYEERTQIIVILKEITLGDKLKDVMFRIPGLTKNDDRTNGDQYYSNDAKGVYVSFRGGLVSDVRYSCDGTDNT